MKWLRSTMLRCSRSRRRSKSGSATAGPRRSRLGGNLHRQRLGRQFDVEVLDSHLDLAGVERRVDRLGRPRHHSPGDDDDTLRPRPGDFGERGMRRIDDALGDPIVVAQVHEQQVAVVALAVHPAGQADFRAGVGQTEGAACVRAIRMHRSLFSLVRCRGVQGCSGQHTYRSQLSTTTRTRGHRLFSLARRGRLLSEQTTSNGRWPHPLPDTLPEFDRNCISTQGGGARCISVSLSWLAGSPAARDRRSPAPPSRVPPNRKVAADRIRCRAEWPWRPRHRRSWRPI